LHGISHKDFTIENYNPQPLIKAELKTGLWMIT
jgi:thymidylate synthase